MFCTLRLALVALCAAGLASQARAGDDFKDLFNGKDLAGWKYIPVKADKTYTVVDGYIKVSGSPAGYFYTDKSYKNYVLKFDWRYKRPANLEDEKKFGGNSGLLVHITGDHKVWPNSLEVQGENRTHGSFISIGNTGLTNAKFDQKTLDKVRNKVGEWNTTEVTINNGNVLVKVNGTLVNSGKFTLVEGPFGFQSEGAELHFKNIKIKVLPDEAPKKDKDAGNVQGKIVIDGKPLATGEIILTGPDGKRVTGAISKDGTYKVTDVPTGKVKVTVNSAGDDKGFKPLFNGKDLKGWKTFLRDDKGDKDTVFLVKNGEIQVSGNPWGYFYTEKSYKNYVIRYSWTYPKDQPEKTTMNSGLLLHIQEPHKVWPKSIEPQGRYMDHGKIFFPGWAKDDPAKKESTFDEAAQKKALKESHVWNTTEATVRADGSISVSINGVPVSTAKTALTSGPIGFQSEGARIHFKDIKIKMLD
ncbi:MAG: DUF1080 domain-containing protein [Planctomycetes bacterium]|nr:DUF1080 domain-containing protein [Planctomycetota bacterium]